MSNIQHAFYTQENRLTDGSVIYEVWQHSSDQRLASAATQDAATTLEMALNLALTDWAESNVQNTVDCC